MSILKNLFNKGNEGEKQEIFFTPDGRKWGVDIDKFTKSVLHLITRKVKILKSPKDMKKPTKVTWYRSQKS